MKYLSSQRTRVHIKEMRGPLTNGKVQNPTLYGDYSWKHWPVSSHIRIHHWRKKKLLRDTSDETASDICSALEVYVTLHFCGSLAFSQPRESTARLYWSSLPSSYPSLLSLYPHYPSLFFFFGLREREIGLRISVTLKNTKREGENIFPNRFQRPYIFLSSKGKLLKIDFCLWKQNEARKYLQDLNECNLLSMLFAVYQDFTWWWS